MARLSLWQIHVARWGSCTRCPLQHCRKNVVLGRGQIPADILFIGESPDRHEDVSAKSFVGSIGNLLDHIIELALGNIGWIDEKGEAHKYTMCFTNLIGCIPLDHEGDKVAEPKSTDIQACSPKMVQFVEMCKPRLIVYVGTLAEKWVPKIVECSAATVQIDHPADILRMKTSMQKNLAVQRAAVKLKCAVEDLDPDKQQFSTRPAKPEPVIVLREEDIPF